MNAISIYAHSGSAPSATASRPASQLLKLLLLDAASDVEVVSRELGLPNEMHERLRRALDRLICAQEVLDAEQRSRLGLSSGEIPEQVGEALRLLAERWPQEYPDGAIEWLLLSPTIKADCCSYRTKGESTLHSYPHLCLD